MGYLKYVNIKQGTKSVPRFSQGNTLPLTQMPYGMISFAPQSEGGGGRWWYHPESHSVEGIRITHQPSPWIGDYGTMLITPQSDYIYDEAPRAWSGVRPEKSKLMPDYLSVEFLRSNAVIEVTPALRSAKVRVKFDTYCKKAVSLFNILGDGSFEIDEKTKTLYGWTDGHMAGDAENFKMYVVIKLDDSIDFENTKVLNNGNSNAVIHLMLKENADYTEFDVAISYISFEQAKLNMTTEIEGKNFDEVRKASTDAWENYLSTIEIETEDKKELKTFYSCMYRTGLFPHRASEVDSSGKEVHYSPYTGRVHDGIRYTDNGFWDTYRTIFPMFTITDRALYADVVKSMLNDYKEGGWLPRWLSIGEVGCMPSTLGDSIIAQAAACEILPKDVLKELLDAMIHHANNKAPNRNYGREGIMEFNEYGYVPGDMYRESVNLTLDFAYSDYCIAKVAKAIGDTETEKIYLERAMRYKNLFDKDTGFMRAKDKNGSFIEPFDPYCWGRDYTEASAWQTLFSVQHDLDGLAELMGGKENLIKKLDQLFEHKKPLYRVGGYGCEIHEMTEMAACDFGLALISNQPGFLLPYVYAHFGEYAKCQYWVEKLCDEAFSFEDDGFTGDEDNGSMASWFILSRLGMYPVCPADDYFVKIEPKYSYKINAR